MLRTHLLKLWLENDAWLVNNYFRTFSRVGTRVSPDLGDSSDSFLTLTNKKAAY
jgi:hypothetical protein